MRKIFYAIGAMSGTSADGIDISLIRTDGLNYFITSKSSSKRGCLYNKYMNIMNDNHYDENELIDNDNCKYCNLKCCSLEFLHYHINFKCKNN